MAGGTMHEFGDTRPRGRDEIDAWAMGVALNEAEAGALLGEIPVGAVLLGPQGQELARGHNTRETDRDPTGHAEIVTLRLGPAGLDAAGIATPKPVATGAEGSTVSAQAPPQADGWRLGGCTLYVTLEPCTMCAGAIVLSRISRLVFGAWDPKAGACGSIRDVVRDSRLNHEVEVLGGVRGAESSELLRAFFTARR